ncbi:MAG: ZIP family metal transporter [Flavobacteriaceae bacterium]|jgi:zinc transporter ZupT
MTFNDLYYICFPFIGALAGILTAKFASIEKTIGLKLILSFSGAFLLGITVFELLPEIYSFQNKQISVLVMGGILFQILLEFFSKGAEHGHYHHDTSKNFPLGLWFSLCLHAIIEGMPLSNYTELSYGIIIHKIPIGIILYLILEKTQISFKTKSIALILFCLMTPLGSLMMAQIPFLDLYHVEITAWVVGMMLHISTTILFESTENHKLNLSKISIILSAILLSYVL